eukprot:9268167-Ditylum_brightwellii.AAC.1
MIENLGENAASVWILDHLPSLSQPDSQTWLIHLFVIKVALPTVVGLKHGTSCSSSVSSAVSSAESCAVAGS